MSPTRRVRQARASALLAGVIIACAGCDAPMSIFGAAGDGGRRISALAWFMITAAAIVYVAVMALFDEPQYAHPCRRSPTTQCDINFNLTNASLSR